MQNLTYKPKCKILYCYLIISKIMIFIGRDSHYFMLFW